MTPHEIAEFYINPIVEPIRQNNLSEDDLYLIWESYRDLSRYTTLRILGTKFGVSASALGRRLQARFGCAYADVAQARGIGPARPSSPPAVDEPVMPIFARMNMWRKP